MSLQRLLEQATPPLRIAGIPPGVISASDYDVTDEVLGTWPDAVRLLTDMAAALEKQHRCPRKTGYSVRVVEVMPDTYRQVDVPTALPVEACPTCALLARFAELGQRADQ